MGLGKWGVKRRINGCIFIPNINKDDNTIDAIVPLDKDINMEYNVFELLVENVRKKYLNKPYSKWLEKKYNKVKKTA